MTKILLALLTLAMMTGAASAQTQRTLYDSRGEVFSRETTTGNQTTIYDASRRNVGMVTTNR